MWCDVTRYSSDTQVTINLPINLGLGSEQALAPNREFEPDTFAGPWDKTRWGYHPFPAEPFDSDHWHNFRVRLMIIRLSYTAERCHPQNLTFKKTWRKKGLELKTGLTSIDVMIEEVRENRYDVFAGPKRKLWPQLQYFWGRTIIHQHPDSRRVTHLCLQSLFFFFFILPTPGRKTRRRKCFETPEP